MSQILRTRYQLGLSVLPAGLMFASFIVLGLFAQWLSAYLGIPENAPVRDQPNGAYWIVIFLVVMVALMVTGYLLGWIINAIVFWLLLGWTLAEIQKVFLYSEVPDVWIKENVSRFPTFAIERSNEAWEVTRKKGKVELHTD